MRDELKELVADSIQFSLSGDVNAFTQRHSAELVQVDSLEGLSFDSAREHIILHKRQGGSLPFKIGSWEMVYEKVGNLFSIGVYKKHR